MRPSIDFGSRIYLKGMEKRDRTGETKMNHQGYNMTILNHRNCDDMDIIFNDGTIVKNKQYSQFKRSGIRHPSHKTTYGVGYMGQGQYNMATGEIFTVEGECWRGMIRRCYSEKSRGKFPTYKDVEVCEEWHNYQNFAKWFEENYKSDHMQGWQLDKDILVKGNKIYSPETCALVPSEINKLFLKQLSKNTSGTTGVVVRKNGRFLAQINSGGKRNHIGVYDSLEEAFIAYKIAKEDYIKEVAEKWRDLINPRVYEAMINYNVEITD